LIELPFRVGVGAWDISKTLHYWVNDGLMTRFFFVVGLEIKREILVGELAFGSSPELIIAAKSGIFYASLAAGVTGMLWLCVMPAAPGVRMDLG